MKQQLDEILSCALGEIAAAKNTDELTGVKVTFLGKSGRLTGVMKNMRDVPPAERPAAGKLVNDVRVKIESALDEKFKALAAEELEAKLGREKIDVTIDKEDRTRGGLHPLTQMRNRVVDFFSSLGFAIVDSPEIETDYYNFKALNIPDNHPARDMQDTFYVTENILLRTQTSAGQVRTMEKQKPPIKMVTIGRVFR